MDCRKNYRKGIPICLFLREKMAYKGNGNVQNGHPFFHLANHASLDRQFCHKTLSASG
ncbi:hypothetical protein CHS0354_016942, partial [Potamilus streckersoni]